jgi:hypothetical protein
LGKKNGSVWLKKGEMMQEVGKKWAGSRDQIAKQFTAVKGRSKRAKKAGIVLYFSCLSIVAFGII